MKNADFVKIDFVGRVHDTDQVFDFTTPDIAKKEGLHNEKHEYVPALVIVGAKMVIPGVEKQLLKMKVGEEKEFTVDPVDAFGPRNPRMAKVFSYSAFIRQKVNPTPGAFVDIGGMRGKVVSVSGGRVRVDFNHPLAGKKLKYWVKVVETITGAQNKIDALFKYYSVPFTPKIEGDKLLVSGDKPVPHEVRTFVEEAVAKWIKEIKTVSFPEKK